MLAFVLAFGSPGVACFAQENSVAQVNRQVQPKVVKIFGGGGLKRLESWQTGFFVASDGLIATVWSYVLDENTIVVMEDGARHKARLVGFHPQFEIALLRIESDTPQFFDLNEAGKPSSGQSVLAFSNLYGVATGNEKCSLQMGVVSATIPLKARRGNRSSRYNGPAIIVDAITNNPGAAGGALTDRQGNLAGMIGREAKSANTDLWLNFAIPVKQVREAVEQILSGQSTAPVQPHSLPSEFMTCELLGIMLVPNVVERTPPFVEEVVADSAASRSGLRADDLIVEVDGILTTSRSDFLNKLRNVDRDSMVRITVQRGEEMVQLQMRITGR